MNSSARTLSSTPAEIIVATDLTDHSVQEPVAQPMLAASAEHVLSPHSPITAMEEHEAMPEHTSRNTDATERPLIKTSEGHFQGAHGTSKGSTAATRLRESFSRVAATWTLPEISLKMGRLTREAPEHPVLCGPLDVYALAVTVETHAELAVPVLHLTSCNEHKVTDAAVSDVFSFAAAVLEKEQPFCMLADYRCLRIIISQALISDILNFMRKQKAAVDRLNVCTAVITNSWILKGSINLILRVIPPAQPTIVATTEQEAFDFLKKHARCGTVE